MPHGPVSASLVRVDQVRQGLLGEGSDARRHYVEQAVEHLEFGAQSDGIDDLDGADPAVCAGRRPRGPEIEAPRVVVFLEDQSIPEHALGDRSCAVRVVGRERSPQLASPVDLRAIIVTGPVMPAARCSLSSVS